MMCFCSCHAIATESWRFSVAENRGFSHLKGCTTQSFKSETFVYQYFQAEVNVFARIPLRGQVELTIQRITQWAVSHPLILAVALVGSQARGTAHAQSDIDLMFLTEQPLLFRMSTDWLHEIDWGGCQVETWEDKDYGAVWSRHVSLSSSNVCYSAVELSFGRTSWASTAPLDSGTQQVVRDSCCILYDPEEKLAHLMRFVSGQK